MNPIAIFTGVVLLGLSLWYITLPFRWERSPQKASPARLQGPGASRRSLKESHQKAILALRDLDFDYRAGKVSEDDYPALRSNLLAQAAKSYQSSTEVSDAELEALIQARRKNHGAGHAVNQPGENPAGERKCLICQATLNEDANYCMKCGTPVNKEFCPHCGKPVKAGDRFCPGCGKGLGPTQPDRIGP